jgi:uncharacterized protein with HEPN domain
MSESRLAGYLEHMLEAAKLACAYADGLDKSDFLADRRTQQAIIMNIIIIGEAATRLVNDYPELVDRFPHVKWRNMRGMRNRMAHGYFDINLDTVWNTVQEAMPQLIEQLTAIRDSVAN